MLTICCVLKSGGPYSTDYVDRLFLNVKEHLARPHHFVCVTDLPAWNQAHMFITNETLDAGWWSKLAAFELPGPVIYLDLDTIVTGSLQPLADVVCDVQVTYCCSLWMLEGFRWQRGVRDKGQWASGIMAWTGDWRWLCEGFDFEQHCRLKWDQIYLQKQLDLATIVPRRVQDCLNVASYKHHCTDGVPPGTDVVCFHGSPRPHEINWSLS